jgi:UDP:flavonoid glycosyltransferase YjiC (YdhE family)
VRLDSVLEKCDAVVCGSGHGTLAASLLFGVPLVILPNHIEQLLLARAAVATRAAVMPKIGAKGPPPFAAMLSEILKRPSYTNRARGFRDKYRDFKVEDQGRILADSLEALAGS